MSFAIVDEVVRLATGRSLQEIFEERVRAPHGLDVHLGLPEVLEDRYRDVLPGLADAGELAAFWANVPGAHSITGIGYGLNSTPPLDQAPSSTPGGCVRSARPPRVAWATLGGWPACTRRRSSAWTAAPRSSSPIRSASSPCSTRPAATWSPALRASTRWDSRPRACATRSSAPCRSATAARRPFADPCGGVAFGYTRRRSSFNWSYPEHDRLAAAVHRAAGAS